MQRSLSGALLKHPKKAKVSEKDAVVTKRGLDAFLEWVMTEAEKDQANVHMLRCHNSYLDVIIWYLNRL